jgi:hypothetical protein
MLDGFGTVVNALGELYKNTVDNFSLTAHFIGICVKPYHTQIVTTIL